MKNLYKTRQWELISYWLILFLFFWLPKKIIGYFFVEYILLKFIKSNYIICTR